MSTSTVTDPPAPLNVYRVTQKCIVEEARTEYDSLYGRTAGRPPRYEYTDTLVRAERMQMEEKSYDRTVRFFIGNSLVHFFSDVFRIAQVDESPIEVKIPVHTSGMQPPPGTMFFGGPDAGVLPRSYCADALQAEALALLKQDVGARMQALGTIQAKDPAKYSEIKRRMEQLRAVAAAGAKMQVTDPMEEIAKRLREDTDIHAVKERMNEEYGRQVAQGIIAEAIQNQAKKAAYHDNAASLALAAEDEARAIAAEIDQTSRENRLRKLREVDPTFYALVVEKLNDADTLYLSTPPLSAQERADQDPEFNIDDTLGAEQDTAEEDTTFMDDSVFPKDTFDRHDPAFGPHNPEHGVPVEEIHPAKKELMRPLAEDDDETNAAVPYDAKEKMGDHQQRRFAARAGAALGYTSRFSTQRNILRALFPGQSDEFLQGFMAQETAAAAHPHPGLPPEEAHQLAAVQALREHTAHPLPAGEVLTSPEDGTYPEPAEVAAIDYKNDTLLILVDLLFKNGRSRVEAWEILAVGEQVRLCALVELYQKIRFELDALVALGLHLEPEPESPWTPAQVDAVVGDLATKEDWERDSVLRRMQVKHPAFFVAVREAYNKLQIVQRGQVTPALRETQVDNV